jgi:2-dehydropantoate 2-reductase
MKVLVCGAGAVGCWLGGSLAAGGAEVTLLARPAQAEALLRDGLTLRRGRRTTRVRPGVVLLLDSPGARSSYEIALVAVKSYATAGLAVALRASDVPTLVSVQNGIGNEGALAAALPDRRVIAGTLTTGVTLRRPGVVEAGRSGAVGLATCPSGDATAAALDELARAFTAGGIGVRRYADGTAMKWSKLLLNLLGSATPAILGWSPAQVFADRHLFGVERQAWLEADAVMRALGRRPVALPGFPVPVFVALARQLPEGWLYRLAARRLAGARGRRLPSVAADLAAGRAETEVDVLNGAVVRAGAATGVATPVNGVLAELVTDLADRRLARAELAGRPELLLARVEAARRTQWR